MTRNAKKRHQKAGGRQVRTVHESPEMIRDFYSMVNSSPVTLIELDQTGIEKVNKDYGIPLSAINEAKAAGMVYYIPERESFVPADMETDL